MRVTALARPMRPESVLRPSYSDQRGRSGTRSTPKRPPFEHDARDRGERGRQIARAHERLEDAVRRHHQSKLARRETAAPGCRRAPATRGPGVSPRTDAPPRARQHRHGSIDADERGRRSWRRAGNAAGAAAQFEHRSAGRRGQPLPEPDVAPLDRLRVLPVVERRVLVPAFPALTGTTSAGQSRCPALHSSYTSVPNRNSLPRAGVHFLGCSAGGPGTIHVYFRG